MEVIAEVQGFHFPFIPFVDFKAVADEVHVGAAAVVFKAGDGAEETASRLEELVRQISGKGRHFIFIPEAGKGFVCILSIALVPGPFHKGCPGGAAVWNFFTEKGWQKGEGLGGLAK